MQQKRLTAPEELESDNGRDGWIMDIVKSNLQRVEQRQLEQQKVEDVGEPN